MIMNQYKDPVMNQPVLKFVEGGSLRIVHLGEYFWNFFQKSK